MSRTWRIIPAIILLAAPCFPASADPAPQRMPYLWLSGSLGPGLAQSSDQGPLFLGGNLQVNSTTGKGRLVSLAGSLYTDRLHISNSMFQADLLCGRRWSGRAGFISLAGGLGLIRNSQDFIGEDPEIRNPVFGFFRSSRKDEHCGRGFTFFGDNETCRSYVEVSSWNVGIPLEAQVLAALPVMGLWLSVKGNLNLGNPSLALMTTFALGYIKDFRPPRGARLASRP